MILQQRRARAFLDTRGRQKAGFAGRRNGVPMFLDEINRIDAGMGLDRNTPKRRAAGAANSMRFTDWNCNHFATEERSSRKIHLGYHLRKKKKSNDPQTRHTVR